MDWTKIGVLVEGGGADGYGKCSRGASRDPTGATVGYYRVVRGGSWRDGALGFRSASRDRCSPGNRNSILGFRPALVPSIR